MKLKTNLRTKHQNLIISMAIGLIASLVITFVLFFVIDSVANQDMQRERLEVLQKFIQFQSSVESLINENTSLLKGYLTYIEVNPNISEVEANAYLERLLSNQRTLIRNIGVIEDTTIIWNYPKEGNEKVIGIDLTTVPSQRNDILKVKNTLEPLLMGPVELVQGGIGFIARFPIMREDKYWGQISIVLDGNRSLAQIREEAKKIGFNLAIFNEEKYPFMPFWGDVEILERNATVLDVVLLNRTWKFAIEPVGGWRKNLVKYNVLKILALLSGLIIGYLLFTLMNTKYKLNSQVMNDYLTGVHNRNYLDNYFQMLIKKSEANDNIIGVFSLDINYFKKINDNYGHNIGDMVLIEFAKKLQAVMVNEKKVFRVGGDEFFVIVSGQKDIRDLKYIEKKIRVEATFRFTYDYIDIEIMPSLGLAVYPKEGHTIDEVMHVADLRMYEEKRIIKENSSLTR